MAAKAQTGTNGPSLYSISLTVAWATSYAQEELNEKHPLWPRYFAYSEWFRLRICDELKLPLDTKWEVIYRQAGCLVEEEYATKEDFRKAHDFGQSKFLYDDVVPAMFEEFEMIKLKITGRL